MMVPRDVHLIALHAVLASHRTVNADQINKDDHLFLSPVRLRQLDVDGECCGACQHVLQRMSTQGTI